MISSTARALPTPFEQAQTQRACDEYFAWSGREESDRQERARLLILATLDTGGVVRETGMGGFTDWSVARNCRQPGEDFGFESVERLTDHLFNRHIGFHLKLQFDPAIECVPLEPSEAVAKAKQDGYTHVETFGGAYPIDEWCAKKANYYVAFEYDPERPAIREVPVPAFYPMPNDKFVLGVWPLTKGEVTS